MESRISKGIWIPIEIWENHELSWNEKILLMEIDSFTSREVDCFFSNEYIENLLDVSERTARMYISKLTSLGYITVTKFDGRSRHVKSNLCHCRADRQEIAGQTGRILPHTNINIINTNNKDILTNVSTEKSKFSLSSQDDSFDETNPLDDLTPTPAKKKTSKTLDERCEDFRKMMQEYVGDHDKDKSKYSQEMIDNFVRHWTAHNPKGRKMLFEMEKVFDIPKRLVTWHNNDEKFNRGWRQPQEEPQRQQTRKIPSKKSEIKI